MQQHILWHHDMLAAEVVAWGSHTFSKHL